MVKVTIEIDGKDDLVFETHALLATGIGEEDEEKGTQLFQSLALENASEMDIVKLIAGSMESVISMSENEAEGYATILFALQQVRKMRGEGVEETEEAPAEK